MRATLKRIGKYSNCVEKGRKKGDSRDSRKIRGERKGCEREEKKGDKLNKKGEKREREKGR